MKQKIRGAKLVIPMIIISMIFSLSFMLLLNAAAINDNMTVDSHSVTNNSPSLANITAGQIWTGKSVSEVGDLGQGSSGQFMVTLSAVGGSTGSALIDSSGLTFNDTFTEEYAFVTLDSQLTFYLNGVLHTIGMTGGVYQYTEGAESTLVEVTLNPIDNTVRYFIGPNALKTVEPGAVDGTVLLNTLAFGVRLKNSIDKVGSYVTNVPDSCTASFNTIQSTAENISRSDTNTYNNTEEKTEWQVLTDVHNEARFAGGIDKLKWIKLLVGSNTYQFDIAPVAENGFDPSTAGGYYDTVYDWLIWVKPGTYIKNGHTLRISNPSDPLGQNRLLINAHRESNGVTYDTINSVISGIVEEGTIINAVKEFSVDTVPTDADPTVVVTAGGVTYTGTVAKPVTTSWSFASGNSIITLVDDDTLTVTTTTSQLFTSTTRQTFTPTHNDYGIVTLKVNQGIAGDVIKEPENGVAGDVEVLPQTGGISVSTVVGIGGAVLIAGGATAFVVYRKKFLGNSK